MESAANLAKLESNSNVLRDRDIERRTAVGAENLPGKLAAMKGTIADIGKNLADKERDRPAALRQQNMRAL